MKKESSAAPTPEGCLPLWCGKHDMYNSRQPSAVEPARDLLVERLDSRGHSARQQRNPRIDRHHQHRQSTVTFSTLLGSRRGDVRRFSTARITPSLVWIPTAVDPSLIASIAYSTCHAHETGPKQQTLCEMLQASLLSQQETRAQPPTKRTRNSDRLTSRSIDQFNSHVSCGVSPLVSYGR